MRSIACVVSVAGLGLLGCNPSVELSEDPLVGVDPTDDSGAEDIPGDTSDSATEEVGDGTITGLIDVSLYTVDESGAEVTVDWESVYGSEFPFGPIFVAAFQIDEETGATTFFDQYVIRNPYPTGNAYALTVDAALVDTVSVYATLDYWGDTVVSGSDPATFYPGDVQVTANAETPNVDMEILAPYYDFASGGGGGGGGGDPGLWVTVSGDALISEEYTGGSCISLLYDTGGGGPYYASTFAPTATDIGAEGTYSLVVPKDWGTGVLIGAWDRNLNGLYDPDDAWGGWVDETGASANPLEVASEDLPDHTLLVPDGSEFEFNVVPFVRLAGTVTAMGDFGTQPAGAALYVYILKYRPNGDLTTASAEASAYDFDVFSGATLTGKSVPFSLLAPKDAIVYLWAYLDADGDGILNEVGDAVASYNFGDGQLATGSTSQTNLNLPLGVP